MDEATARYYNVQAGALAARYESVASSVSRFIPLAFPEGSRVLDVGAGSGRDLVCLLGQGYDADGVEPSDRLRQEAFERHPELQGRLVSGCLPKLGDPFEGRFDGILCSAVLMHVPQVDLFDTAFALRRLMRPHGRLLVSLPLQRDDVATDQRDADGRLFMGYTAEYLQLLFERIGMRQIGRWDTGDALGRAGTRWFTLLFELDAHGALRPVDQIEGILDRDRKVATYKFALFRALAEMATQEPQTAVWMADGRVGVPLDRIADRWLLYYWPIFASEQFVPQSQAEGAGGLNPVAFRAPLQALMAAFAGQGAHSGLSAWQLAWSTGRLGASPGALARTALRTIARTVVTGPVLHSGGSLDVGTVFTYEPRTRHVVMAAELWRELSLLGHWIVDAVIVRWAALTERFARRQAIGAGEILPLLLAKPTAERASALARQVFEAEGVQRCAWSDRSIAHRFAVDHVIPFSLWSNNDLWNLLPVDCAVNGQKSDKLPSGPLMNDRRASIVRSWEMLRDALPTAFDRQAGAFMGRSVSGPRVWQAEMFARLREAVEVTALQRGIERWTPKSPSPGALN